MPNGHRESFRMYYFNETAGHYPSSSDSDSAWQLWFEVWSSDSEETCTRKHRYRLLSRRTARAWKRVVRHVKMTRLLTVNRLVPKPIDEDSVADRIASFL